MSPPRKIRKTPDEAEHTPESFRMGPGHGEGTYPAGTGAGNRPIVGIGGEVIVLRHLGKNFVEQESREAVTQAVYS